MDKGNIDVKKNFIFSAIHQILLIIIPLITIPYIARKLGSNMIGRYAYSFSITHYFVLFAMLGLNNYGSRCIARSRNKQKELIKTFCSIYYMQLVISIFFCILYIFYILKSKNVISMMLFTYMLSTIFDINWFFTGIEEFKITMLRNISIKIISTIFVFLFVKKQNDIYIYTLIMGGSLLLSQIILWFFIKNYIKFIKVNFKEIIVHLKPNLTLFIPVISVSIYKIMDKIMLGNMSTIEHVGFYESAEKIINIPIALSVALGTVMMPRVTKLITENNRKQALSYMEKSIAMGMFFSTSLCFGIMAISDIFVPLFYGRGYENCIILFNVLLPSCIFMSFSNIIRTQYLLPEKEDTIFMKSIIIGAIINIIVNYWLIPKYASLGTALGTLIAECTVCLYQTISIRKKIEIKKYILVSIPYIVAGLLMFISVKRVNFLFALHIVLILKICIGIAIYFFVIISFLFFSLNSKIKFIEKKWLIELIKWR